jgi:DNA-binding transcriptional LysR family regulator
VELRQLATFVAVAEEGRFGRAGERLHVVQSAVSATIRKLEQELDARLFDRSAHHVELTDAGRKLLPAARRTLAAAEAARDAVDELRGGLRGTVRIGLLQALRGPEVNIPRMLGTFGSAHPDVQLELRMGGSTEHAEALRAGRLDLAYLGLPLNQPGLEMTPLSTIEMQLVVPTAHRLAARAWVELSDVSGEPFADGPPGYGNRIANDRAFLAANTTRSVSYEITEARGLVDFVHFGFALALLPNYMLSPQDDVVAVPIHPLAPAYTVSIAHATNREPGGAARALLETAGRMAGVNGVPSGL